MTTAETRTETTTIETTTIETTATETTANSAGPTAAPTTGPTIGSTAGPACADQEDGLRSRLPDPMAFLPELGPISGALQKAVHNGAIPPATIALVQLRAGQLVGSTYHTVRQTELLRKTGASEARIAAVASWPDAPYFDEAEQVALELAEAVLTANPIGERVPDELFARASIHYDELGLWTLTLAIAQICFFVPVALIARPIPGRPLGKNYSPREDTP